MDFWRINLCFGYPKLRMVGCIKIFCYNAFTYSNRNCVYSDGCSGTYRNLGREDGEIEEKGGQEITMPRKRRGSFKWGDYILYLLMLILFYLFLKSIGIVP